MIQNLCKPPFPRSVTFASIRLNILVSDLTMSFSEVAKSRLILKATFPVLSGSKVYDRVPVEGFHVYRPKTDQISRFQYCEAVRLASHGEFTNILLDTISDTPHRAIVSLTLSSHVLLLIHMHKLQVSHSAMCRLMHALSHVSKITGLSPGKPNRIGHLISFK